MTLLAGTETEFAKALSNSLEKGVACQVEASVTGTVEELKVFLASTSTATEMIVGLLKDSAGVPGTLIAEKAFTFGKKTEFQVVPGFSASVTKGEKYWLALLGVNGSANTREGELAGKIFKSTAAVKTLGAASWTSLNTLGPLSFAAVGKESGGVIGKLACAMTLAGTVNATANGSAVLVAVQTDSSTWLPVATAKGRLVTTASSVSTWITASKARGSLSTALQAASTWNAAATAKGALKATSTATSVWVANFKGKVIAAKRVFIAIFDE